MGVFSFLKRSSPQVAAPSPLVGKETHAETRLGNFLNPRMRGLEPKELKIVLTGLNFIQARAFLSMVGDELVDSPHLHEPSMPGMLLSSMNFGNITEGRELITVSSDLWELRSPTVMRPESVREAIEDIRGRQKFLEFGYDVRLDGEVKTRIVLPLELKDYGFLALHNRGYRFYNYGKVAWVMPTHTSAFLATQELTIRRSTLESGETKIELNLTPLKAGRVVFAKELRWTLGEA